MSHPTNQMGALSLFRHCHLNVACNEEWFTFKDRFIKARYRIGIILWSAFPLLALGSFLLAIMELSSPGVTSSGKYASVYYLAICLLEIAGACLMFPKIGTAITLVEEYKPVQRCQENSNFDNSTRRSRDIEALIWMFSSVHLPTIDQHILDSPHIILNKVFYFWEGFKGVYTNSLFNLYDSELKKLVDEFYAAWSTSLSFSQCYHSNHDGSAHIFSNPGDAPLSEEQEIYWQSIDEAGSRMRNSLDQLLSVVRNKYIEIDILESNSNAWREYIEHKKKFEKLINL